MDCRVVVEAAVPVYDVGSQDEAIRIAISKTGDMLNPDLNYVEIAVGARDCPHCDGELEPAFVAADEGLVALELMMRVFNVEDGQHASRIARKEIGQRMHNIPLEVLSVDIEEEEEVEEEPDDDTGETDTASESAAEPSADDEDLLPEFEELIDE